MVTYRYDAGLYINYNVKKTIALYTTYEIFIAYIHNKDIIM